MHQIAMRITQQLHFDMTRATNQLFEIHLVVAKGGGCFAPRDFELRGQLVLGFDHPHAPTAAAPTGLEHQGITDGTGQFSDFIHILRQGRRGGHDGHTGGDGGIARSDLVAQGAHHVGLGTDEDNPVVGAGLGKIRIL